MHTSDTTDQFQKTSRSEITHISFTHNPTLLWRIETDSCHVLGNSLSSTIDDSILVKGILLSQPGAQVTLVTIQNRQCTLPCHNKCMYFYLASKRLTLSTYSNFWGSSNTSGIASHLLEHPGYYKWDSRHSFTYFSKSVKRLTANT